MKEIPLTKGYVALVDDEDYEMLSQHKWHVIRRNNCLLYASARIDGNKILMHRMIMGEQKGSQIDHKDRNGLNNQKHNLRTCTFQQNAANCRKHIDGTSGYKGVSPIKGRSNWQAGIRVNGKRIYLGHFNSKVEAAIAYDTAARDAFGEFARLNFPSHSEHS